MPYSVKWSLMVLLDLFFFDLTILSSGSMRGFWIEELGFIIFVGRVNIDPIVLFDPLTREY
jgi:hypothetical protein